jgi:hypothetical protein
MFHARSAQPGSGNGQRASLQEAEWGRRGGGRREAPSGGRPRRGLRRGRPPRGRRPRQESAGVGRALPVERLGERRNLMSYNGLGMQKKWNRGRILHNDQDRRAGAVRRWRRCPQFPAGPPVATCALKRLFQARRSHQSRTAATGCLRGCGRGPPSPSPSV